MTKDSLKVFQKLNQGGRLVKQDPEKDTCVAVVYLNLAIYLGKNPPYSQYEVKEMLDYELKCKNPNWESNVFPRLAGEGNVLKSRTFKLRINWLDSLSRLVNEDKTPVGVSIKTNRIIPFHAIIALKVIKNGSNILIAYDPLYGFVELEIKENNLLLNKTGEIFFYHPKFHIYYP